MMNPFGPNNNMGSYADLRGRFLRRLKSTGVDMQISTLVQNTFEDWLASEHLVLARVERQRLFNQVFKTLLEEMAGKLDNGQDA